MQLSTGSGKSMAVLFFKMLYRRCPVSHWKIPRTRSGWRIFIVQFHFQALPCLPQATIYFCIFCFSLYRSAGPAAILCSLVIFKYSQRYFSDAQEFKGVPDSHRKHLSAISLSSQTVIYDNKPQPDHFPAAVSTAHRQVSDNHWNIKGCHSPYIFIVFISVVICIQILRRDRIFFQPARTPLPERIFSSDRNQPYRN